MAGIYLHIPFCHAKCAYCDFYSVASRSSMNRVCQCMLTELSRRFHELEGHRIDTVYFGGGTPSLLSDECFKQLASEIKRLAASHDTPPALSFSSSPHFKEFTIEANPEDISPKKVALWQEWGVNRVSMGVQSLVDSELSTMRRRHKADEAENAYRTLIDCGIKNISLDLIFGLPGQTLESWEYSARRMLFDLHPQHFSAYILSINEGTMFARMLRENRITLPSDSIVAEMYSLLTQWANEAGYEHYEISNYALPGYRSKHNSSYWRSTPYLGIGPAAHSFTQGIRRENPSDIAAYCSAIESGQIAYICENETDADRFNDIIITALRTAEGIDLFTLPPALQQHLLRQSRNFLDQGLLTLDPTKRYLAIPEQHFIISNSIIVDLML